jgi:hypothetical protein
MGKRTTLKLPPIEELREDIERRSDDVLLRMVSVDAAEYREDVLDCARAELRRRGKEPPTSAEFVESLSKEDLHDSDLFCARCRAATTDEGYASWPAARLRDAHGPCDACGSVVRDQYIVVFHIPLVYIASYRVKQYSVPWPGEPKILALRRLRESDPVEPSRRRPGQRRRRRG